MKEASNWYRSRTISCRRDSNFTYIGIFDDQNVALIEYNPALRCGKHRKGSTSRVPVVERRDKAIRVEAVAQYQGTMYGRVSMVYSLRQLRDEGRVHPDLSR